MFLESHCLFCGKHSSEAALKMKLARFSYPDLGGWDSNRPFETTNNPFGRIRISPFAVCMVKNPPHSLFPQQYKQRLRQALFDIYHTLARVSWFCYHKRQIDHLLRTSRFIKNIEKDSSPETLFCDFCDQPRSEWDIDGEYPEWSTRKKFAYHLCKNKGLNAHPDLFLEMDRKAHKSRVAAYIHFMRIRLHPLELQLLFGLQATGDITLFDPDDDLARLWEPLFSETIEEAMEVAALIESRLGPTSFEIQEKIREEVFPTRLGPASIELQGRIREQVLRLQVITQLEGPSKPLGEQTTLPHETDIPPPTITTQDFEANQPQVWEPLWENNSQDSEAFPKEMETEEVLVLVQQLEAEEREAEERKRQEETRAQEAREKEELEMEALAEANEKEEEQTAKGRKKNKRPRTKTNTSNKSKKKKTKHQQSTSNSPPIKNFFFPSSSSSSSSSSSFSSSSSSSSTLQE